MAQTFFPLSPTGTFAASHMNLRDEAHAKSRTFSARNTHVLVPSGLDDSFFSASSGVTMNVGSSEVSARRNRSRCITVSTSSGFCSSPVAATM